MYLHFFRKKILLWYPGAPEEKKKLIMHKTISKKNVSVCKTLQLSLVRCKSRKEYVLRPLLSNLKKKKEREKKVQNQ